MKSRVPPELEKYRVRTGSMASTQADGRNGGFLIPHINGTLLTVLISDGSDWEDSGLALPAWEHVSVSTGFRTPHWEEMDFVKRLFFGDDETVMQLHVPRAMHVNYHEHCLHLWRPVGIELPLPPPITVGPQGAKA